MKTEQGTKETHQDGPSWKIVARYPTYDEADQKRLELAIEQDMQVKVHWQGKASSRYYAVKARQDPEKAPPKRTKNSQKGKRK